MKISTNLLYYKIIKTLRFVTRPKNSNQRAVSFEHVYADSGYWDYALLKAFSHVTALHITHSTSPISELTIVEKIPQKFSFMVSLFKNNTGFFVNLQTGFYAITQSIQTTILLSSTITIMPLLYEVIM